MDYSRSTIHFTLPYIFNRNTYNCQSQVTRDRRQRSELAKVSDVDRRTNTIHVRSAFSFAQCALGGQTKSNKGFLGPMEKGFPLVSECDGAVVRTLRTEHCLVTCDAVPMFFAVTKTTVNYFLQNWNTKLVKFFTSFVCLVQERCLDMLGLLFVVFSVANCITLSTGCFISRSCPAWSEKKSAIFCRRQRHQCRGPQANIQPSGMCYKKGSATSII